MKMMRMLGALLLFACASGMAVATTVTLDFEGLVPQPRLFQGTHGIGGFYNGGQSGYGTAGQNYGVGFSGAAVGICLSTASDPCTNGSHGGHGDPASAYTALGFQSDDTYVNVANGFVGTLYFNYASPFVVQTVNVWEGYGASGNLLASLTLARTPDGRVVAECGFGNRYCPFVPADLSFTGVGHSFSFTGAGRNIVVDDITFTVAPVPEPETYALLLGGLGLLGLTARRRKVRA